MHIKRSSAEEYRKSLGHLLSFFGPYELKDIAPDLVQEFISRKSKSGLSAQTIRNYLTPMTRMLNHAVQWQLGHASIQMTFDLYGHRMTEVRHEAVRKLDAQVCGTG